jgi:hypothetical protein
MALFEVEAVPCLLWPKAVLRGPSDIAPVAVQHVVDLQPEHRYCLLMEGLRKHIHHMQLVQPVAGVYHCL